jgi:hypothetical protein
MRTKKPQSARSLRRTIRRAGAVLKGCHNWRTVSYGPARQSGQWSATKSSVPNRVPGHTTIRTKPLRIVIADSRDLAYEYGKVVTEFDLKSGEHVKLEAGLLRVWQKQAGEWKEAAVFTRPYDAK